MRPRKRDDRDYDTTQLRESSHGRVLHRDYSAHFFRWSFARRFIGPSTTVLEIGCGQDKPLSKILTAGQAPHVLHYTGVDLNKLSLSNSRRLTFMGEFNFIERHSELKKYDVIVCMEVVEHFHSRFMPKFMNAVYQHLHDGGTFLLSTPCFDGRRMAANHINEMTVEQLQSHIDSAKFKVNRRYGTFMDIKNIGKPRGHDQVLQNAIQVVADKLSSYYDNDALSCFFAPLYPDHARNNIWVLTK